MKTFTCFSWVCVLTLLSLGHSSGAGMLGRRSLIETFVKKELATLEKRLKADEASVKQTISDLRNEQKDEVKQRKEVDKKQVATTRCLAQKVGFMATFAKRSYTEVKGGKTVVYDKVITNIGNAYNPGNGRFTATNPGMYAFTVTVYTPKQHGKPYQATNLNIKVNDEIVTSEFTYSNSQAYNNAASARAVVQLSAGDVVTVWADDFFRTHTMYQWSTDRINTNTFSGALIQPDCPQ